MLNRSTTVWAGCVAGGVGRGEGSRGTRYLHIYIHIIIIYIITYINKVLIAFTTWDTDGDGYLSWEEFHQISNNSSMSEEQAVRIFQHCDKVSQRPSVSLRSSASLRPSVSLRPCASLPLQIIFSNVRLGEARSPWRSSGRLWRAGRARGQGRGQDPPPRGVRTVPSSRMRTLCLINSSGNTNN